MRSQFAVVSTVASKKAYITSRTSAEHHLSLMLRCLLKLQHSNLKIRCLKYFKNLLQQQLIQSWHLYFVFTSLCFSVFLIRDKVCTFLLLHAQQTQVARQCFQQCQSFSKSNSLCQAAAVVSLKYTQETKQKSIKYLMQPRIKLVHLKLWNVPVDSWSQWPRWLPGCGVHAVTQFHVNVSSSLCFLDCPHRDTL